MDERRLFNRSERSALYWAWDGKCAICGTALGDDWEADHSEPYSLGGKTDVINGQPTCKKCNRSKGNKMARKPRPWHQRFFRKYHHYHPQDFLLVACPGAGKSYAAAYVAKDLLAAGEIERVLVLVRDKTLRKHWHDTFREFGIWIDYDTMNDPKAGETAHIKGERTEIFGHRVQGWVVTYTSVMTATTAHRTLNGRRRTLVILDEIHHLGDQARWGQAAIAALEPCVRRLGLSGTPFRGNKGRIPFVEYEADPDEDGLFRCRYKDPAAPADPHYPEYPFGFDYSYGTALTDKPAPVRPLLFQVYDGDATWLQDGELWNRNAVISDPNLDKRTRAKVRRHALNPAGDWLRSTLRAADQRLATIRGEGDPQAKGVVFCMDTIHANEVFLLLNQITPGQVRIAVSQDENGNDVSELAGTTIENFKTDDARWIVVVRMVSEGVDIPRLRVGVYATNAAAPLLFAQMAGRLVRHRSDLPEDVDQTAYFLIPKDPDIIALADSIEAEVKGALISASEEAEEDGEDQDRTERELTRDQFIESNQHGAEVLLPGNGTLDSTLIAAVANRVGDGEASAARHLAELAKMGLLAVAGQAPEATETPTSDPAEDDYKGQVKRAKNRVTVLVRQVTSAELKRRDGTYSQRAFSEHVKVVWGRVKDAASIEDWNRVDLPALRQARQAAAKMLGEL